MKNDLIVTGVSGFVGSNLLINFSDDYSMHKVSRQNSGDNYYSWSQLDQLPKRAKAFIHLAGKAHDLRGKSLEQEYTDINVGLTMKAFDAFKSSESEIFIYFSSVKAVASQVEGVLTENDKFDVDTPYGVSKWEAEKYLLSQELKPYQRLYILRPCMIHGKGNKGNLNLLFKMAQRGIPYPFGAYANERSMLGVNNLMEVIREIILKKPENGIYNLSDDGYIGTRELYQLMGIVLEKRNVILNIPKPIISMLGKIGDWTPLPIDSSKITKLTENYRVSNAKIKTALGWEKMPYGQNENLKNTLNSFK